jgi:hypothetical protein
MIYDVNPSTETFRERTRDRARHDVRTAARAKGLDQAHLPDIALVHRPRA